ncbi:uncharacterized protein MKK02DRAFT_38733 [Dioszegia hungarica]|uniref:Uncharacterized protein n=1 Tax=Dioszegia hungarica TaxID=4972 RepID=A0AA38LR67_9TREE|nr:uncharacterized protein MKK02DRAFT_38733 [Dioszegia hungarica]KAI9634062.1 hypothetical protein MKK02DRAFT_38733 [Dioszegia hungarica]
MISDTVKIVLVVVSPVVFFSSLVVIGLLIRRRVNKRSPPLLSAQAPHAETLAADSSASNDPNPGILGPSVELPAHSEKVISVRRLSAYPHMDEIRRVSSVVSTLGDVTAVQQERTRRGSTASISIGGGDVATTLIVTEMGDGHVGVERRPSIPEAHDLPASSSTRTRAGSASTSSATRDPGSPQDKRFSMHLSYIVPSTSMSPSELMETLTTPLPPMSATPHPRSPTKKKERPDSIELAMARSPTLVSHHHPPPAPPAIPVLAPKAESPHTDPGQIFKGWEGFSSSPPSAVSRGADGELPPRRSSLDGKQIAKLVAGKTEKGPEGEVEAETVEIVLSPARIALPKSPDP